MKPFHWALLGLMSCKGSHPASPCEAESKEFFRTQLWEPILSVRCIGCHNASGPAQGSHLVLHPASEKDALDANFAAVSDVAHIQLDGTSVLLLRPVGKFPQGHPGGTLIEDGSKEFLALKAFVDVANGADCGTLQGSQCDPAKATAGRRVLRRLTNFEYDNTLRDLVGVAPSYGASFPPDDVAHGFDDIESALHVAPIYTTKARAAAEDIGATLDLTARVPCPLATGDDACAQTFIADFGQRAFRRPMTAAEKGRFLALHQAVAKAELFEGGVRAVLTAMLQSPNFLYRTELGTRDGASYALTPWEIASELSYLLTGSMPDAALFTDAASGALAKPEILTAHAVRLLQTDGARGALEHFVRQWLQLSRLEIAVKDPATYPQFTKALAADMVAEGVQTFVRTMSRPDATFADLYAGKTTWASDGLAQFYGLGAPLAPADATGIRPYTLPPDRSGFLTQAAILATQAKPDRPSPVHRGKLVREQLLCQTLPPPPAGVNTQLPAVDPNVPNRERFQTHSQNQPCASCHRLIDDIGFGFEGFDGIGRPVANANTAGEIVGTAATNKTFTSVTELSNILAQSPDAHSCFALQWYRFGYGIDDDKDDSCGGAAIHAAFEKGGLNLQSLILALVRAEHFVRRVPDADDGAPPPPLPMDDAGTDAPITMVDSGPAPQSNIAFMIKQDSSWQTGYCNTVNLTNTTSAPITWTVSIPIDGTLQNFWSATETTQGGAWVFQGVMFNATLGPSQMGSFGYCVAK